MDRWEPAVPKTRWLIPIGVGLIGLIVISAIRQFTWRPIGAGLTALFLMLGVYILAPRLLLLDLDAKEQSDLKTVDRIQAINSIRSFLLQGLAAVGLLIGLLFTAQTLVATNESLELNRQSNELDRQTRTDEQFLRAIDQLGQSGFENTEVRAGGIYALGLLADQARGDKSTEAVQLRRSILRLLQSYLFQRDSRIYVPPPLQNRGTPGGAIVDADFQAAVTVLTRHPRLEGEDPLNFYSLDLPAADLRGAHLEEAYLGSANLEWADLRGAHLEGTELAGACLRRARLDPLEFAKAKTHGRSLEDFQEEACGRTSQGGDDTGSPMRVSP